MFEYVCEHVIPGCTAKERGDTPEAAREKALEHLHRHHGMEYIDEGVRARVAAAILRVPR